ncbi:hypothetical protein QJS04_geneDACA009244 [Acorus gramineus]|uniref:Uncharacterized protein n=1 Tax=Acorus gramineus TaxID=55184 RepID=A0AAV9AF93_ACOGR|nr:hypothetical protein QJS04_geneDACA009244 [Acorus gramineus]
MDREPEELQFLGFFGICKEATTIITSLRRLFTQLTLSFILPLSLIFLIHSQISNLIFSKIDKNETALETALDGSPTQDRRLSRLSSEWTAFLLFKLAYLICLLILSLLSTSAVVYTVACAYTSKDTTFKKVMSVAPKVWKRLMVTFLWNSVVVFAYNSTVFFILVVILILFINGPYTAGQTILIVVGVLYLVGLVYITVIWRLACVVSVLEDSYGLRAMKKSKELIKGKMPVAALVFFLLIVSYFGVLVLFEGGGVVGKAVAVVLLSVVVLMGLVVETVIYFVCKSYHHESIDSSALADHLEVYLVGYVPLTAKDVQLEQFHV